MSNIIQENDEHSCVLFDLDNTLIGIPNTWHYFDELIQQVLEEKFHLPIPDAHARNQLWRSGKAYIKILKNWGVKDPDDFWVQFDLLDSVKRNVFIETGQLILYEDVSPILQKLSKDSSIKTGLVTNTPMFIAQVELKAYHLTKYFDAIIGLGDDQMICKPEPDGILQVLKELGCLPQNAIYIGDSVIDLLAAQNAEVLPILIERSDKKKGPFPEIDEKDYVRIQSLPELFNYIR